MNTHVKGHTRVNLTVTHGV